ncbi:FG-GAP repeat protein [Puia sp. P3]|uniref:FG-GAP and VCBS repeat-containing protein n=1 Tax=Puia sp. P3 TaxID=3423952 RepID=UPI003D664A7A
MDKVLTPDQRQGALILESNDFRSCMLRNDGQGRFMLIPLPPEAQWSALNGMAVGDYNGDGNLDILINGNDYGGEPSNGRYDAMDGLLLAGDGKGGFVPRSLLESGVYIPGNGKGLVRLRGHGGSSLLAAGQNRGPLKIFALRHSFNSIPFQPSDVSAQIHYRDGRSRKEELYYGASFLSQSARFVDWTPDIQYMDITNVAGGTRRILK